MGRGLSYDIEPPDAGAQRRVEFDDDGPPFLEVDLRSLGEVTIAPGQVGRLMGAVPFRVIGQSVPAIG